MVRNLMLGVLKGLFLFTSRPESSSKDVHDRSKAENLCQRSHEPQIFRIIGPEIEDTGKRTGRRIPSKQSQKLLHQVTSFLFSFG
jgi:hypothetical protein